MDDGTAALAGAIGARVRDKRQERRWTLDQLAEAAGVSRRMVVSVEQATVNPSVGTLLRLADALGLSLSGLVEIPTGTTMTVTRGGEGATLWSGPAGGRGVLVAATGGPDVVELWEWTIEPGEKQVSDAHKPGTRELLHVHEGTVILTAADAAVTLEAGDAVVFEGAVEHSYSNGGDSPARFSMAVFEPDVGRVTR